MTDNKFKDLYISVNELMCALGRDGEINAHQKESTDVMNALWEIDGGCYDPELIPQEDKCP